MDTTLLKTFLEVAKTRHFGKAADALYVTQSAVSARIKLLESNLGVELFIRRRNDIQLTPAGMRLIRLAETIVNGWERARHEIALGEKGSESIALGCPFDLWGILLRNWAICLRNQSPNLVLQIEVQPSEILISRLVNGLIDLAILFEPPQISNVITRQVAEIPLILVTSQPETRMQEAMEQNYYMVDWGSVFALQHAGYFPDIPPPAARVASGTLALDLILETGGSAYLAQQMVQQQLDKKRLFIVTEAPIIERTAFAIYRPEDDNKGYLKHALKVMSEYSYHKP
ncbi:MAG: LysR family transcriptional regulator [Candidatus Thiodiazotropha sp.]|jgi:LysR family transcriptional regulator, flagellar master operon regulator